MKQPKPQREVEVLARLAERGITRRERQILSCIAEDLKNKEIGEKFFISEQTVKNTLHRLKKKLGAKNRIDILHRVQQIVQIEFQLAHLSKEQESERTRWPEDAEL